MARLLAMPCLPAPLAVTELAGPNARNSGANTFGDGSEQTFDHLGDVWALSFERSALFGADARRERGWKKALLGGRNAIRIDFFDADRMTAPEAGGVSRAVWSPGAWSSGAWGEWLPRVSVAQPAAFDTSIITLTETAWGHDLDYGDYVGFEPFHFGMYAIVHALGAGRYRIWPRLRKALTTADFANLTPVLAMRPSSALLHARGLAFTVSEPVPMVEVFDYHARDHFADFA